MRNRFQQSCLVNSYSPKFMTDRFDQCPSVVRRAIANARYDLCVACVQQRACGMAIMSDEHIDYKDDGVPIVPTLYYLRAIASMEDELKAVEDEKQQSQTLHTTTL